MIMKKFLLVKLVKFGFWWDRTIDKILKGKIVGDAFVYYSFDAVVESDL